MMVIESCKWLAIGRERGGVVAVEVAIQKIIKVNLIIAMQIERKEAHSSHFRAFNNLQLSRR
jgi:hypothetical protein